MERDLLAHFPVVLTVARRGGFAAAAAELGMSASAVSHAVKTVEDRLGQILFHRTTRSVALTQSGETFLASVGPALSEIGETLERMQASRGVVAGTLRINAPSVALPIAVTPVLENLARRHPALTVEITTDQALTDIVAERFDAGIRLGEMIAQDMVAVRLTPPFKAILVAAPAYLKTRDAPKTVADLQTHNCIGYRLLTSGAAYGWELSQAGKDVTIDVVGSARVSDPLYARELALTGLGIAYIFEPLVARDLKEGRLRRVLPQSAIEEPGFFLYYPRRMGNAPRLRAFIDAARSMAERTTRRQNAGSVRG